MTDVEWMRRAIECARRGLGHTAPNPSVGAVLVRDGQLLGEGTTEPIGGRHAEIVAIDAARAAGHDLRGATLYVTLEPCRHVGRTPPCTGAILDERLARVVVGTVDPYPPMQGASLAMLRERGVAVELGVEETTCREIILGFNRAVTSGLPEVTAKVAVSLDGHLATAMGESQWITGEAARADGHHQRNRHDALLVGIGTVLADDPRLTCRLEGGRDPVPVVLDTDLRIPEGARLFGSSRRPVVICAEDAPHRTLAGDVVRVPRGSSGVDLQRAFRELVHRDLHRVLVEGGAGIHRALFDAGLVDTLLVYLAPMLIPGGRSWLGGPPLDRLGEAVRLELRDVVRLESDVRLRFSRRQIDPEA